MNFSFFTDLSMFIWLLNTISIGGKAGQKNKVGKMQPKLSFKNHK